MLTDGSRCPCTLQVGRFHYDHLVPAALTEDASLGNCQVLCKPCHAAKTVVDVGVIARVRRVRDQRAVITVLHRRSLSGGKASPFKRLIDGGVVRRDTGERLDNQDRTGSYPLHAQFRRVSIPAAHPCKTSGEVKNCSDHTALQAKRKPTRRSARRAHNVSARIYGRRATASQRMPAYTVRRTMLDCKP
ncbi:hypothetical protein FV242_32710 [Methylobacterium sp. WL64]|uniref:HNH endonuclease n=1 Tax=Methylobacterium sp. WL64 TaxID=2603894 RepID=UPI0011CBFC85|nr:hypothetical protein FV242_32710 [Methylobacterium sp. WL64]